MSICSPKCFYCLGLCWTAPSRYGPMAAAGKTQAPGKGGKVLRKSPCPPPRRNGGVPRGQGQRLRAGASPRSDCDGGPCAGAWTRGSAAPRATLCRLEACCCYLEPLKLEAQKDKAPVPCDMGFPGEPPEPETGSYGSADSQGTGNVRVVFVCALSGTVSICEGPAMACLRFYTLRLRGRCPCQPICNCRTTPFHTHPLHHMPTAKHPKSVEPLVNSVCKPFAAKSHTLSTIRTPDSVEKARQRDGGHGCGVDKLTRNWLPVQVRGACAACYGAR